MLLSAHSNIVTGIFEGQTAFGPDPNLNGGSVEPSAPPTHSMAPGEHQQRRAASGHEIPSSPPFTRPTIDPGAERLLVPSTKPRTFALSHTELVPAPAGDAKAKGGPRGVEPRGRVGMSWGVARGEAAGWLQAHTPALRHRDSVVLGPVVRPPQRPARALIGSA